MRFEVTEDIVHDNRTGLDWEVKSCDSSSDRFFQKQWTWEEFNKQYIDMLNEEKFAGFTDWRVPSKDELRSLIDYRSINPAYNADIFKNLLADDYWCGVSYGLRADCGWVINLNLGSATAKNKALKSCCMAVRGENKTANNDRFVDNGDGTITDKVCGLMWQKAQPECKSYIEVQEMLKDFELAGHRDWRLPTMHELNTIFDESYSGKSFYFEAFESDKLQPPILQHITANIFGDTYVWVTNFNFGYDGYYAEKTMPLCYRLVRTINADTEDNFQIPASGQAELYSAEGEVKSVNPELSKTSFIMSDGFVTDTKTGLNYARITPDKMTFDEATAYVKQMNDNFYGGRNDWRLPSADELRFIVDYSGKSPAVFGQFIGVIKPDFYWTREKVQSRAWSLYFGYGCVVPIDNMRKSYFIAVSGGKVNLDDKTESRYEIEDEVVTDKFTGLMWLRAELSLMTVAEAEKYLAENKPAGYSDWRIPEMKELSTLVRRTDVTGHWFDEELFPDVYRAPGIFYLARETFNGMFNWGINVKTGYDGYYADRFAGKYRVKPVRNVGSW